MMAKKTIQLQLVTRHAGSGSSSCEPIRVLSRFLRNTSCPAIKVPAMSQYSTVGFHLMKVSFCSAIVAPPNSTMTRQADPLHGFHLAGAVAQPDDLDDGRRNRHACGHIDAGELERDEEQDDGEKVEQQFHRIAIICLLRL